MKATTSNRQRKVKLSTRQAERDSLEALRILGLGGAELSLIFVGDARMRALNKEYRGVDKTTDVLSFPQYESRRDFPKSGEFLIGDVVINPRKAKEQARDRGHSLKRELRVLLVHGIVHLLGLDHEKGGPAARKMRTLEKRLLEGLEG